MPEMHKFPALAVHFCLKSGFQEGIFLEKNFFSYRSRISVFFRIAHNLDNDSADIGYCLRGEPAFGQFRISL